MTILGTALVADNSADLTRTTPAACAFDGVVSLKLLRDESILVSGVGGLFHESMFFQDELASSRAEIRNAVESCLRIWSEKVVHLERRAGRKKLVKPFLASLDRNDARAEALPAVLPQLATAGAALFRKVFAGKGEVVTEIRRRLAASSGSRLRIVSDDVFVPWGMLYTHPGDEPLANDGSNAVWEGFWGLSRVVDHEVSFNPGGFALQGSVTSGVRTGVHYDERIDADEEVARRFNEQLLKHDSLAVTMYETKAALLRTLGSDPDQILYLYCHGRNIPESDEPALQLRDDEWLTAFDIECCTGDDERLPGSPLVFINSCKAGRSVDKFYETVAKRLLKENAAGVIGSYTEIPCEFAASFAWEFFTQFLTRDVRVFPGDIMRGLSKDFITRHHLPLGLSYVSYRAAGCYVNWQ